MPTTAGGPDGSAVAPRGPTGEVASSGLWFGVLGPLEVRRDGQLLALRGPRERALLALLLSEYNRTVSVPRLVDGVWGAVPPPTAEKTLRSYIARLRRLLEPDRPSTGWRVLVTAPSGYSLRTDAAALDAALFEQLVEQARPALAAGAPELAFARFRRALGLWRGEAYEDLGDAEFAVAERDRLGELRLAAVADRVDAESVLGHAAALVSELQRLVAEHPLRERFWGQLMIALYESGRQAEALEAYRSARTRLVDEIAVEPSPQLRALDAAILAGQPSLLPDTMPTQGLPAGLGGDRNPLVGREIELHWLEHAWARAVDDTGGAVVIDGEPGMGTSRLVTEFARRVSRRGAAIVVGSVGAETLAGIAVERPVLVVLDDRSGVDPHDVKRLVAAAARLPVLVVVAGRPADGGAEDLSSAVGGADHVLRLGPLGVEQVSAVVADYVSDEDLPNAAEVVATSSGGVPARVHEDSAAWAAVRAGERVGQSAVRVATGRRELAIVEHAMVTEVLNLQRARNRRTAPPAGSVDPAGRTESVICPYKGLEHFDEPDAPYFFGREWLVGQLVTRCVAAPLLAVVGPSGSGKSSVVRAGLVPALRSGVLPGSDQWRIRLLQTGAIGPAALDVDGDNRGNEFIVLDQFEEAVTMWAQDSREEMINRLVGALTRANGRLRVVLTVRADYYGWFARYPALACLIGDNTVLVGPMAPSNLRRAIEEPARVAGLDLEEGFANTVLADVRQEPGALPLLSTALLATWESRDGRMLPIAAYRQAGGVAGAITRLADSVYDGLDEDGRVILRRLFLRLVTPGEGGDDLRRRASRSELAGSEHEEAILAVLIGRRLVTAADETVEVAHEALLWEWPRLRAWLEADRDGHRVHRHLAEAAGAWAAAGCAPGDLYRDARLQAAQEWADTHPGDANPLEQAFLAASAAAQKHTLQNARRTARRLRSLASVLAILLVIALTTTGQAIMQRSTANHQTQLATGIARSAQAGRLAALAASLGADQVDLALLLGVESYRLEPSWDTEGGLQTALAHTPASLDQVIRFDASNLLPIVPPSVSPDGRLLAEPQRDGTVRLWDLRTGQVHRTLHWSTSRQLAIFSADATLLAVGGNDGTIVIWDVASGERVGTPIRAGDGIAYGQFDPSDPSRLFAVDNGGHVALWDRSVPDAPRQIGPPLQFPAQPGDYPMVVVNADGSRLAAGIFGGTSTRVWDAHSGTVLQDLPGAPGFFAPNGVTLPTTRGNQVVLWDVNNGQPQQPPLTGFTAAFAGMVISNDGHRLAVNDGADCIRVFDLPSGRQVAALPLHGRATTPTTFLPDGRLITSGTAEADIWSLDTATSPLGRTVRGHTGRTVGTFIPRSTEIITQGIDDGQVLLWDAATGRAKGRLLDGAVMAPVAFSPDGALLAGTGQDGTARLWERASGAELGILAGAQPTGRTSAVAWSPAGGQVAIASGGSVLLWDVRHPREPYLAGQLTPSGTPHPGVPDGVYPCFSPDGRWLAVEDVPGRIVTLFDAATGRLAWSQPLEATGPPALAFSPDNATLAVGYGTAAAGVVEFRDVRTGAVQRTLQTPSSGGVEFLRGGSVVMTTSDTGGHGSARLWDATTLTAIGEPLPQPDGVYSLARSPDGATAVAGTSRGAVQIWDVSAEQWAITACRIARRNLTKAEWSRYLPDKPYRRTCPLWPEGQ